MCFIACNDSFKRLAVYGPFRRNAVQARRLRRVRIAVKGWSVVRPVLRASSSVGEQDERLAPSLVLQLLTGGKVHCVIEQRPFGP